MRILALPLIAGVLATLSPTSALAVIDPNSFTTISPLIVSSGTLTFDTDSLRVVLNDPVNSFNNTTIANGVLSPQPNGVDLAVFPFDYIQITGSTNVQFSGHSPVALASKGGITITSPLSVSGDASTVMRLGGYAGGSFNATSDVSLSVRNGTGPGGGQAFGGIYATSLSAGGGYGGPGGDVRLIDSDALGGMPYGDLSSSIEGGSGGASAFRIDGSTFTPNYYYGGHGGGSIAIVAKGAVSLASVQADGANANYSGAGAGGGILISGSNIGYSYVSANGGSQYALDGYGGSGGGGRIALYGVNSVSFDSPTLNATVSGGLSFATSVSSAGHSGVITVSPQTFIATGTRVLDGSLLHQQSTGVTTLEVDVRRNLTVSGGARVTLGKNQPLDMAVAANGASTAQLQLLTGPFFSNRGVFDTGAYSQPVGALTGGGELHLGDGGRLTVDGTSTFSGIVTGSGTLAVSSGAQLDMLDPLGGGYPDWTGTAEVGGTLRVGRGSLKARVVSTTSTAQLVKYDGNVDLAGDLSQFHGTLLMESGTLRVAASGALSTPAAILFSEAGISTLDLNGFSASVGALQGSNSSATLNLNANILTLGSGNGVDFYNGAISGAGGIVKVGSGYQDLSGALSYTGPTTVREGHLAIDSPLAAGGTVRVEAEGELIAEASISRQMTGVGASSIISVAALAPISLGSPSSFLGFSNQGELRVNNNSVTINSAGAARPGGLTTLGLPVQGTGDLPGTIVAPNSLLVDFGDAITGFGTINTPNTLAKRMVVNGVAQGTSATERLTFTGYVKGTGSFDNVTFTGTFSPGLSPAIVTGGSITLAPASTLEMELGGLTPGSGYDKLQASGALTLGGALDVSLLGGFVPAAGNTFDLLDWGSLSGTFSSLVLPTLGGGLGWNTSQLYTTGVVSVVTVGVPGDYNSNGVVDAADYIVWRKNQGSTHTLPNDPIGGTIGTAQYDQWRAHFGQPPASGAALGGTAVPEPTSAGAIVMVVGILGCCRRRMVG